MLMRVQLNRFFLSEVDGTQCRYSVTAEMDVDDIQKTIIAVQRMPLPDIPGLGGDWREMTKDETAQYVGHLGDESGADFMTDEDEDTDAKEDGGDGKHDRDN